MFSILLLLIAVVSTAYGVPPPPTLFPIGELFKHVYKSRTSVPYYDECSWLMCFNGGTCNSDAGDAWCSCQPGYHGSQCLEEDNSCAYNICYNGGTCQNFLDSILCICPDSYYGFRCEHGQSIIDYNWNLPTQPGNPDWNPWEVIPTLHPVLQVPDFSNDDDFQYDYEETNLGWVAPTTVIAIVVLGTIYGGVLYAVRRKRRLILVRTIQVGVSEAPTHPSPPSFIHGVPPGSHYFPTRCLSPRVHQGVTIPAQFPSDDACLIATEPLEASSHTQSPSPTVPTLVTSGAPPPYAEVAPTEGGQSINEPPPPYSGL